jgi:hypothetical protein
VSVSQCATLHIRLSKNKLPSLKGLSSRWA